MNQQIDPRGPKFTAAITALVLAVILWTAPSNFATALLVVQTALFGLGAALGIQRTPTSWAFRNWIRPLLAPPANWEDAAPPRFAQGVGFGFGIIGVIGFGAGADLIGVIAVGFALAAAVLNAVFGLCLGCEFYLLLKRLTKSPEDVPSAA